MAAYYTYMLHCADGTLYTGWTTDVTRRLKQHNSGTGAKYTRNRGPVRLAGCWRFETRSEAMRFEIWIKRLPRHAKNRLLSPGEGAQPAVDGFAVVPVAFTAV
ncbi:MAG: GIY-YIG nuclease family protein [Candidatus Melainabacteria bacterium]